MDILPFISFIHSAAFEPRPLAPNEVEGLTMEKEYAALSINPKANPSRLKPLGAEGLILCQAWLKHREAVAARQK